MAPDHIDVIAHPGFGEFCVASHDRGGRVAHRMTLDHLKIVQNLATFDIRPTQYVLSDISC